MVDPFAVFKPRSVHKYSFVIQFRDPSEATCMLTLTPLKSEYTTPAINPHLPSSNLSSPIPTAAPKLPNSFVRLATHSTTGCPIAKRFTAHPHLQTAYTECRCSANALQSRTPVWPFSVPRKIRYLPHSPSCG